MSFRSCVASALAVLLIGATAHAANVAAPNERLSQISERYFEDELRLDPLTASSWLGEERFNGKLNILIAPTEVAKEKAVLLRVLREISTLPVEQLDPPDQLSLAVLKQQVQSKLDGHAFPQYWMPVDQYGGLAVELAQLASGQGLQPLKTVTNYEDYLKRLTKVPAWNKQAISNIRQGMAHGVVNPKALIERSIETLQRLIVPKPEDHPYFLPI